MNNPYDPHNFDDYYADDYGGYGTGDGGQGKGGGFGGPGGRGGGGGGGGGGGMPPRRDNRAGPGDMNRGFPPPPRGGPRGGGGGGGGMSGGPPDRGYGGNSRGGGGGGGYEGGRGGYGGNRGGPPPYAAGNYNGKRDSYEQILRYVRRFTLIRKITRKRKEKILIFADSTNFRIIVIR